MLVNNADVIAVGMTSDEADEAMQRVLDVSPPPGPSA